jgi:hypothetical protein
MAELTTTTETTTTSCCAPEAQATCCEPSAKAECCDPSHGDGCGCSVGKGADEARAGSTFCSAKRVGPTGKAHGLDITRTL